MPGLPGLYLAGASTHPGGGVSGNSGRTAARCCSPTAARSRPAAAAGRCAGRRPAGLRRRDGSSPRRGACRGPPAADASGARGGRWCLTAIAYPLTPGGRPDALDWTIVLLGAAPSVLHAALAGGRAGGGVLVLVAAAAVAAEAVGVATGVPFGTYAYAGTLGPTLLGVPLVVPLAWVMMAWPAGCSPPGSPGRCGRSPRVARSRAAAVFAAWDLFLDPQMVDAGHWTWADPAPRCPASPTVPLTNYAGWLVAASC